MERRFGSVPQRKPQEHQPGTQKGEDSSSSPQGSTYLSHSPYQIVSAIIFVYIGCFVFSKT